MPYAYGSGPLVLTGKTPPGGMISAWRGPLSCRRYCRCRAPALLHVVSLPCV